MSGKNDNNNSLIFPADVKLQLEASENSSSRRESEHSYDKKYGKLIKTKQDRKQAYIDESVSSNVSPVGIPDRRQGRASSILENFQSRSDTHT